MKTQNEKVIDIFIRIILILAIAVTLFIFAIRPMFFSKDFYYASSAEIVFDHLDTGHDSDSYDVVVIGDSIDGIYSAMGAAKVGARTLLICSGDTMGDTIQKTCDVGWSLDITPTGNSVSSDIYKEMRYKAGEGANFEEYIAVLKEMAENEKKLEIVYNARLLDATCQTDYLTEIKIQIDTAERNIQAKRYIDGTEEGELLQKCNVSCSSGYEDIGIAGLYPPAKLNFMVSGIDFESVQEMLKQQKTTLDFILKSYIPRDANISVSGFNITEQGNATVIVEAVTVKNVDLSNDADRKEAYQKAAAECMDFYNFLKLNLEPFKSAEGATVAQQFTAVSAHHFKGRYRLTLTDVLTGKRFSDRISTASGPVTLTLKDRNGYILCNPKIFYIPLRAILPEGLQNVLMTGDKISVSSLVQKVVGSNSCKAGTGYAAGIIAAYSISRDMELPQMVEEQNLDTLLEIERTLRRLGIFMSDIREDMKSITDHWSFRYMEKLNNIGLLSGGIINDFRFDKEAKQEDFSYLLLNGVSRVSSSTYNYAFDVKMRKYMSDEPLDKETFAKMLLELDGRDDATDHYYPQACQLGLIDGTLQEKLKNKEILLFADVYYAAVQVIEKLTGKSLTASLSPS